MKAWLITWEWANDSEAVADKVVGVLNPRWGVEKVSGFVELLYSHTTSSVNDLAFYAKKKSNNFFRVHIENGKIDCGHNPFLTARKVSDLKIDFTDDGREIISWKEPPKRTFKNRELIKEEKPIPKQFTRRIIGPVSHQIIWDRINSKFIDGWGPGEIPGEYE